MLSKYSMALNIDNYANDFTSILPCFSLLYSSKIAPCSNKYQTTRDPSDPHGCSSNSDT